MFRKKSIALRYDQYVCRVEIWKNQEVLSGIKIYVVSTKQEDVAGGKKKFDIKRSTIGGFEEISDVSSFGTTISAGKLKGDLSIINVPKDSMVNNRQSPIIFTGAYFDGKPNPRLIDLGIK